MSLATMYDGCTPGIRDLLLSDPNKLKFSVFDACYQLTAKSSPDKDHIRLKIRPEPQSGVSLSSGESFADSDMIIYSDHVEGQDKKDARERLNAIGLLVYYKGNGYTFEVTITSRQFQILIDSATVGRYPSFLVIGVQGIELGVGSECLWDNVVDQALPIQSVEFSWPWTSNSDTYTTEQDPLIGAQPSTRLQIDQLLKHIESHRRLSTNALWSIFWVMVVLVVITLVK